MIFLKKKHVIPKQGGGGGGPPFGKNSHIFPFFFVEDPYHKQLSIRISISIIIGRKNVNFAIENSSRIHPNCVLCLSYGLWCFACGAVLFCRISLPSSWMHLPMAWHISRSRVKWKQILCWTGWDKVLEGRASKSKISNKRATGLKCQQKHWASVPASFFTNHRTHREPTVRNV